MAIKICLDAGHYGKYNRSPAVKTYYESDMNWKLHLLLKKELESYGIEVITTRADKDKNLDLVDRGKASKGCDLFISIHSNAAGSKTNDNVDYPLAIVQLDGKGKALGKKLADAVKRTMGCKQNAEVWTRRGTYGGEYYGVLWGAANVGTVGMILENSFHTCTKSAKWLSNDANLAKLAKAEAQVIAEHFGIEKTVSKNESDFSTGHRFLKNGCRGIDVEIVQAILIHRGYNCGKCGTDGILGSGTEKAIKQFQQDCEIEADGVVGPVTMSLLLGV